MSAYAQATQKRSAAKHYIQLTTLKRGMSAMLLDHQDNTAMNSAVGSRADACFGMEFHLAMQNSTI
jgi:hypothetical protein